MFGRLLRRRRAATACTECPLAACASGCRAAVLRMECADEDAERLRGMGLYEGSCVEVVDAHCGMVLEVRGARLALGRALAASIRVLPLGS
jgi:Fe2+ transport system protein FeoA